MDPNNNFSSTPNPVPGTTPNPAAEPAVNPAANPVPNPVPNPVANPVINSEPNPTVNPAPVQATAASGMTETPVNPIITPAGTNRMNATEPILRPEPAPAPDPVKEELNAPMVAAAPVPGSIGSAVSGQASAEPTNGGFMNERRTPNVAFNDPATQPDPAMQAQTPAKAPAKKSSKPVLVTLIVVALAIVAVLVVMLVMQLTSGSTGSASTANTPTVVDVDDDEEEKKDADDAADETMDGTTAMTVKCYRAMTAAELANYANATSGTVNVEGTYDENDALVQVSKTEAVLYADSTDPSEEKSTEVLAEKLTAESAAEYGLPVDKEGGIDLNLGGNKTNWTELGYTCE